MNEELSEEREEKCTKCGDTARVREVMGEVEMHSNEKSLGKTAYNELHSKVTQELNSLEL